MILKKIFLSSITKRVQKLMNRDKLSGKTYNRRSNFKKDGPLREERENREGAKDVWCYKFKKLSHVKYDSSLDESKRKRRKVMMATWSQSEDSSNDENENEVANMCLMAFDDLDEVNSYSYLDKFMIEYEELLNDIKKLHEKNSSPKKKISEL